MTGEGGGIWYVQHYAGGPGVGRYGRGYELARRWIAAGVPSVVFGAAVHHSLDHPQTPGPATIEGVPYEFVPTPPYTGNGLGRVWNMAAFTARFWRNGRSYARRYGVPRMIVASSPQPYLFVATHRVARQLGALSVFEVRDLWPLSLVELGGVGMWHPLALLTGAIERHAYRNADQVVSLLPHTLDHMQKLGLSATRWHYIPNGIDIHRHDAAAPSNALHKLQAWRDEGRFVVVYCGALGYPNNVGILVEAMAGLEPSNVRALIVGRGEEEALLRAEIAASGLDETVAMFGQVSKEAALSLIDAADAGFVSLRDSPVFRFGVSPNKLLDYMSAGIPVISAIRAGNDPVGQARCGFSVPPNDSQALAAALRHLSELPAPERRSMGRRGHAFVRAHHDYDVLARQFLEIAMSSDWAAARRS